MAQGNGRSVSPQVSVWQIFQTDPARLGVDRSKGADPVSAVEFGLLVSHPCHTNGHKTTLIHNPRHH
jgi:hypothetical protein